MTRQFLRTKLIRHFVCKFTSVTILCLILTIVNLDRIHSCLSFRNTISTFLVHLNKMPCYCCIKGCSNTSTNKKGMGFFSIPKVITRQGSSVEEITSKRLLSWLRAINRKGFTPKYVERKRWLKVCGNHFIKGKPAYVQNVNDPDWVPCLHLGYDKKQDESRKYERLQQRKSKKATGTTTLPSVQPSSSKSGNTTSEEVSNLHTEQETESATKDTEKGIQTDMTSNFISVLESEVHTLAQDLIYAKSELEKYTYDENYFKINEEKVKYYTGLPTFKVLKNVYGYLEPAITTTARSCLTKFQQLLIVLFKLKLSLPFRVLADMFKIHPTTASKIFIKVLDVMYVNMSDLIFWPDKESLRKTMPKEFIRTFGRKVTVIIDCFEIFIERPSSVKAQAQTYSSYKHNNTVKYLIGITPQGAVSYLSCGWGGRTSDKHIVENSSFLDNLEFGDLVLADRGFDVAASISLQHAEIKIPAFTKGKQQLTALDVEQTRKLAHLRIHVERVIGNALQKYKILQDTAPIDFLVCKTEGVPTLDKIVRICFCLINVCPSVVPLD